MNFIDFGKISLDIEGSSHEQIHLVETELGFKIPLALKEYLLVMGEKTNFYEYWDEHGTKELVKLKLWIYEWIDKYRSEGIGLSELKTILPFFNFQDTFFYVPIEEGNENPPVYAFDINDTPTIRKLNDSFTDFVLERYNKILKNPDRSNLHNPNLSV
ncbi:SMI1/KNR4 family protein [Flavobacterium columnare]|uniref:SMI1/KNR4 family protein n=1 Tax=Flavobacterium columnare TaxID=996 RepID=UPI0013D738D9|nr:SMI1/KNR4 family protein [Flavobacterium columnare]